MAKKNGLSLHDKIGLDAGQSESGKGQTVESNLYKSLNTSFSIKKIENGQTFKLSDLASVSKIKGLENVSPELETVAKLKDKETSLKILTYKI
ncbi:ABC transporter permease [Streptococcus pneumoniae]|nr:ABC transporter permease [Streptococcus pneumoniae]